MRCAGKGVWRCPLCHAPCAVRVCVRQCEMCDQCVTTRLVRACLLLSSGGDRRALCRNQQGRAGPCPNHQPPRAGFPNTSSIMPTSFVFPHSPHPRSQISSISNDIFFCFFFLFFVLRGKGVPGSVSGPPDRKRRGVAAGADGAGGGGADAGRQVRRHVQAEHELPRASRQPRPSPRRTQQGQTARSPACVRACLLFFSFFLLGGVGGFVCSILCGAVAGGIEGARVVWSRVEVGCTPNPEAGLRGKSGGG